MESINHIRNSIEPLYNGTNKAPTTLFVLSKLQYKQVNKNSIHLSGISLNIIEIDERNKKTYYIHM